MPYKSVALIVGGTSGLGLSLARKLKNRYKVVVVGRRDPQEDGIESIYRDLSSGNPGAFDLVSKIDRQIGLYVYAAGFFQDEILVNMRDEDLFSMINVGLTMPVGILRDILSCQEVLPGFIAITSAAQFRAVPNQALYTAVKSGLGMFASTISQDPRIKIGKTMVIAPAGMKTNFHKNTDYRMLDPEWVADEIINLSQDSFKYLCAMILREPPRTEMVEKRS